MSNAQLPKVAKTVHNVATLRNRLAKAVANRAVPLTQELVDRIIAKTQFGYQGRRPLYPFTKKGNPRLSDMDLFSFLVQLQKRDAVLRLPSYNVKLPRVTLANEDHMSQSRFGTLENLIAHKKLLSFGVRLFDHTVVRANPSSGEESIGAYRTFMVVDYEGKWHDGWKGLSWRASFEEAAFSGRYQLRANECATFKNYVHPNRRESIFGAPYLLLKLLWMRLEDEIAFCRKECKRLEEDDVAVMGPSSNGTEVMTVGEGKTQLVPTFEVKLSGIALHGAYAEVFSTQEGHIELCARLQKLQYQLLPLVQFICRADEVAFYHYGMKMGYTAPWVKGGVWVTHASADPYQTAAHINLTPTLSLSYKTDVVSVVVAA